MDNKKERLSVNLEYDEKQAIPLAVHEMHMSRKDRTIKRLIIGLVTAVIVLASVILAVIAITTYERLQYDYSSSSSVEASGVYNLVDAEGNVLTSDISPEDVIHILQTLNNGESEDNTNQNS